jgi:hypothetical protein
MATSIFRRREKTAGDGGEETTVVRRTPRWRAVRSRTARWRRSRHNPVSAVILAMGWAAVVILGLGILLTWGNANPGNMLVDATLDAGRWLATPFHDVFTRTDPEQQLYLNWAIAAGVYYLMARVLSWLTRF